MTLTCELYGEICHISRSNDDALVISIPELHCAIKISKIVEIGIEETEIDFQKFTRIKNFSKKIHSNHIIIKNLFQDINHE